MRASLILPLALAGCVAASSPEQSLTHPAIAVFVQPGMVNYGGAPAAGNERLVRVLSSHGLAATALDATQLADPKIFNARHYTVLVMPYGNAFPLPAFDNLRRFHAAGGCMVMTGIPFCHPCKPNSPAGWFARWGGEAQWLEEGHQGSRAVRIIHKTRDFQECTTSRRWKVSPGEKLRVSGWVRSAGNQPQRDFLFVRFFSGGAFVSQEGPAVPAKTHGWKLIYKTVTVPPAATEADVSLQVWSPQATVDLDDVSFTKVASDENLISNPGFEKGGGEWEDLGHQDYFDHSPRGMGTGGFGGPAKEEGTIEVEAGNVLGFRQDLLPRASARLQWLDESTLPPEDEVLPVVQLRLPGGERHFLAGAIRHNCAQFREARDIWVGQVAPVYSPRDRYCADQIILRGTAWCLKEKGRMTDDQYRTFLKRLDAEPRPRPMPDNIEIVKEPRPWGDTFFPKSSPPARELLVVDCRGLSPWERLALTCLQGLTSRRQPVIWLIFTDWDKKWLDWHKEKGYIGGYRMVDDWQRLFKQYASLLKGAVVPDTDLYQGVLLACNVAACEDLIVAPPSLCGRLGLKPKIDLRGRFKTYAEGLRWLWSTYRDRLNHHLCIYAHPNTAFIGTLGYDIEWRGLIFWISGRKDGVRPGADSLAEMQVMAEIFAQMPPNIGMRGFPWAGEGVGLGEGGGVEFCGSYGKGLVCTDHTANFAVMSGVQIDHLTPPSQPPTPAFDPHKTYIALTMSDGDNLNTFYDYFRPYFEHPAHGRFPIGWGMGPAILDLMPGVAQWYYEHARPGDEFLADVSGIAYVFPQTYARRYRERWKVFDGFLQWTGRYMNRLGMRTVRPHGGDRDRMTRYARALPFMHSIFADYAWRGMSYEHSVYTVDDGMPVFHALTHWRYGKTGLLRNIRDVVGSRRPAFVNAFLHNWTYHMDDLDRAYRQRDADMAFVTPAQLADLYKQARQRGLVK